MTTTTTTQLATGTWNVDAAHSELAFVARHLMVSKVRGSFGEFNGTVEVAEPLEQSSVSATVQMASVDTGNADRNAHLRSADFFDVEQYPTMTFTSTGFTGDSLTGDLTIKGVTRPVTFDIEFGGVATDPWGNAKAGFEATADVNRKDWGLEWNVSLESGGVLVSEKIRLILDIQLTRA